MRPYQRLPVPFPCDHDPGPSYFYDNFVSHFIPDMIKMVDTGLLVEAEAVENLRTLIDEVQETVYERLNKHPYVIKYQENMRRPKAQREHEEEATKSVRTLDHYLKPFKETDMTHRTWLVNTHLLAIGRDKDVRNKWSVKDVKEYNVFLNDPFLSSIIDKRISANSTTAIKAMHALAEYKLELWNRPRYEKQKQKVTLEAFNPNSSKQTCEIFQMLKIPATAYSKDTGEPSWGRDQIEELRKESKDEILIELLDAMIDNSFSFIIKSNFIKAFDTFTIDKVLHGKIKLFGAKSFRNTSNSPNLLNAPSSKSIYAKPLKRCFAAKKDFVIYTADLSALEDRVISNLSKDVNKCNVFKEGLDGHSLNACGYYSEEIEKVIGKFENNVDRVKAFMQKNDEGNSVIKSIRQKSKGPTFKLAYGGFPDIEKGGVITQEIFDRYHNVLYPGITDYRDNYVLPTSVNNGYIHLGLGCRLYTDNPHNDIRTLHNATVQFWSILTLIAVNELNYRIEQENLEKYVQVQSTIYDSIYTQTYRDPEIIKWVNENLIEVMTVQYLQDEEIHNEAEGEIGLNWADLHKIPNNASIQQIEEVLAVL
jgi:hypothetical protein